MLSILQISICPRCGASLNPATEGLCFRCLLAAGIALTLADDGCSDGLNSFPRPFGEYELLEEIARGGMGVVYKARQKSLDRLVAIKALLFGARADSESVRRFRAEATVAAGLQHPNIVAIHEIGVHEQEHYLVMDLVDGPNLADFIKGQPLTPRRAAGYMRSITRAVEYAHAQGILHRDLKPSNVLIDSNDQPRVTDFGLAKRLGVDSSLTLSGHMLGSPSYMPPEQARGIRGGTDRRSDIYSLGAMLYHLLTGRPPFLGATLDQTLNRLFNDDPISPRLLNPDVPRDLETICLRCLEKEPVRRYESAGEIAGELELVLQNRPIRSRPVTRIESGARWCRRNPAMAAISGVVLLLVLGLLIGSPIVAYRINLGRKAERQNLYAADISTAARAIAEGDVGRARELLRQHLPAAGNVDLRAFEWHYLWGQLRGDQLRKLPTNLARNEVQARYLSISPDGELLAALDSVWSRSSGALRFEVGPDEMSLAFAPNGREILVRKKQTLLRRALATGNEVLLLRDEGVGALCFSPSGRWMATGSEQGLRLWDTTTWTVVSSRTNAPFEWWRNLRDGLSAFSTLAAKGLAFSPDERRLVTVSGYALAHLSEVACWTVPSLDRLPMPPTEVDDASCVLVDPGGAEFITAGWDGDLRFWDLARLTENKSKHRVGLHRSWVAELAFIPATHQLVSAGADRCIRISDLSSPGTTETYPVTLRGHAAEIWSLAVSPDGQRLYSIAVDREIMEWRAGPTLPDDLAISGFGSRLAPAGISAKGDVLATVSENALNFWRIREPVIAEERAKRVELTGFGKLPLNSRKLEGVQAVSPDFKWLALRRPKEALQILDIEHNQKRVIGGANAPDAAIAFSADSRFFAFLRSEDVVAVFDTKTWSEVLSIRTPGTNDVIFPVQFASQANVLGAAGRSSVVLWDLEKRRRLREMKMDPRGGELISYALSADASMMAMGYPDDRFTLHNCATGEQMASVASHTSGVELLAFSPDGKTVASGSGRWVRLWNVQTQREMFSLEHANLVIYAAFTPDGRALITGGVTGITRVWRIPPE